MNFERRVFKGPSLEVAPTTLEQHFAPAMTDKYTTLTYEYTDELDLNWVKMNHHAKYVGQRSFRSKVILQINGHIY